MSKTSRMNKAKAKAQEQQPSQGGKTANDTNKQGSEKPTQKNEGRRTPESRHDRESHVGSQNQTQAREGNGGMGH